MDYLKQDLFNSIEGKIITVETETENSRGLVILEYVYIDTYENLCSNNNEIHINWEVADIEKTDDIFTIKLPEITYTIGIGE